MWENLFFQFHESPIYLVSLYQENVSGWTWLPGSGPDASREIVRLIDKRADSLRKALHMGPSTPRILAPGSPEPFEVGAATFSSLRIILCVAALESPRSLPGDSDFSGMTVAWFQDQLAYPVDPDATSAISLWNWDALASSCGP